MPQSRVIVGLGEAALVEGDDAPRPGGLACDVALAAVALGHRGVVVSRVGQDERGRTLLASLERAGAGIRYVQADPDLPTGRFRAREDGRPQPRTAEGAAFDQLQWDFDLEDLARETDVACFGPFAWRSGQARSESLRFLDLAAAGCRIVDLANRPIADGETVDLLRAHSTPALAIACGAVVDGPAVRTVLHDREAAADAAGLARLVDRCDLRFAIGIERPSGPNGDRSTMSAAVDGGASASRRRAVIGGGAARWRCTLAAALVLVDGGDADAALRAADDVDGAPDAP